MKRLLHISLLLILFSSTVFAQETKSFNIKGRIKSELIISLDQLKRYTVSNIGTVSITNHKGELKGQAKDMKGILLTEVLKDVVLDQENPKLFSEYYFVCTGSDNYKAVFSWNELFNTKVADRVFIVTEKDGKNMVDNEDGILMISADDAKTGRRFVKNLATIYVGRAE